MTKPILKQNYHQPEQSTLSKKERAMVDRRANLLGPAYKLFYEKPIHFVRGEDVWLYDSAGNQYLDAYNNVPSVGHCHPHVVEALSTQAAILNTHTRYLHEGILEYAEHLLSTYPDHLDHLMMTLSGSEANDLAYRIAKYHTGGTGVIVTNIAYHGGTDAIAAISPNLGEHVDLGGHVRTVAAPDMYRGDKDVGRALAQDTRNAIHDLRRHGIKPAMMIVDTIFSTDGIFGDPAGFLQETVELLQKEGILFVADEVQLGFGRSGDTWWGFQRHEIEPDIVTMGKAMGGGHPMAGLVIRHELLAQLSKSRYFNTTGGNPVSCAVGKAVLEVIEQENLIENAGAVGNYLQQGLRTLSERHEIIGDVRGSGLFIGVELVRDRNSREPASEEAMRIVNECREKRLLLSTAGIYSNVLKIRPPLTFSQGHADQFLQILDEVLTET